MNGLMHFPIRSARRQGKTAEMTLDEEGRPNERPRAAWGRRGLPGTYNSGRLGAAALAGHGVTLTPQALSEGCQPENRPRVAFSGAASRAWNSAGSRVATLPSTIAGPTANAIGCSQWRPCCQVAMSLWTGRIACIELRPPLSRRALSRIDDVACSDGSSITTVRRTTREVCR
jgi:hypothetical protein